MKMVKTYAARPWQSSGLKVNQIEEMTDEVVIATVIDAMVTTEVSMVEMVTVTEHRVRLNVLIVARVVILLETVAKVVETTVEEVTETMVRATDDHPEKKAIQDQDQDRVPDKLFQCFV